MLPSGYLPARDARGNAATAPAMALIDGRLPAGAAKAVVAGDVRANENIALTATQTLFAREHNRIVSALPNSLSQEDKFQIARRVVIAEQQYITYNEFLPALGVDLPALHGLQADNVNPTLSNEFATVGYRAHSQIHGEFEIDDRREPLHAGQLDALEAQGVEVDGRRRRGRARRPARTWRSSTPTCSSSSARPAAARPRRRVGVQERRDDRQPAAQRAVPGPVPGNPTAAWTGRRCRSASTAWSTSARSTSSAAATTACRSYNQLRSAYGLPAKTSFTAITGESTDALPGRPAADPGQRDQRPEQPRHHRAVRHRRQPDRRSDDADGRRRHGVRRTTLAARLKAIYGERHKRGRVRRHARRAARGRHRVRRAAAGDLEAAVPALRDGDRFFYLQRPGC